MKAALRVVAERVAEATGMDPRSLDASRLQWIIERRLRELKCPDINAYGDLLKKHDEELLRLIEEVVIQETRFFRDAAVFEHIRKTLARLAEATSGTLRLLSAPCGTGQEAYSLAAAARQVGVLDRVTIGAVDISTTALATARRGLYPASAMSGVKPELRSALGSQRADGWQMDEALRARIHFEHRNLAAADALGGAEPYDLILCRNLFIYLHPEARQTLASSLAAALVPGGRLVIGSADNVEEISAVFAPIRPAASFAFSHRVLAEELISTDPPQRRRMPVGRASTPAGPRSSLSLAFNMASKSIIAKDLITLKNDGRATVTALYKQALQHQQLGNIRKAERFARQALYLNPSHLASMELLQMLWHQQPNQRLRHALTARILRTRASLSASAAATREGA